MKKIKILQVLPYFPPHLGGLEIVSQEIAKHLVKYHDVDVINLTSDIGQKKRGYHVIHQEEYTVVTAPSFDIVHHFPCFNFWSPSFWKAIRYVKREKPDIIQTHTRFFLQTFLGGILAKFRGIKRVHVEHGSGFVTGIPLFKKIVAWVYDQTLGRLVFRCCDQVVSINNANVAFISRFTKKEKIQVIYNGIDAQKDIIRRHIPGFFQLTFVGRLTPLKGVDILIDACKQLLEQGISNRKLDIVGDGEMKSNLLAAIHTYGLSDHISLVGPKSHDDIMEKILPSTDILVNPSHQEGLPTTVLEGLLSGCVVVATDVGGTKEISDKDDLVLVRPGDVKSLYIGLEKAVMNYDKITGSSKEYVGQKFDRKRNVEQYYKVYSSMIGHEK